MKKALGIVILLTLLFGCNNKNNNEFSLPLYKSTNASKADSITTEKPFPLVGERIDTVSTPSMWLFKSEFNVIPFSNQDRVPDTAFQIIKNTNSTIRIKFSPSVKKVTPSYAKVYHPKPIKTGELRSTGIANENITYLGDEQGLPSLNISHMLEDEKGFFWISHSAGFSIYNGVQLINYSKKNGIPAPPTKIIKDPANNSVWMATPKGLVNYDGRKFLIYNKESGFPAERIKDLVFDRHKNLWLVCDNKAILKLKDDQISIYDSTTKLPVKATLGVHLDPKGDILINTWDVGIRGITQNNDIINYKKDTRFISSFVTCFFLDNENRLWVGTYGGGFALIGDSITTDYRPNTGFPYFVITSISQDIKNRMWFSTGDAGLVCREKNYFKIYTTKQGLTSNKISCVMHDKAGNAWIGTEDAGINKITPGSFRMMSDLDGFTDKTVSHIFVNKRGEVLLGTITGGLYSFNGKYFKHYKTTGYDWKIILGMSEDSLGNLYVATDLHGIDKFLLSKNDSIGYDSIYHIRANKKYYCQYALNVVKDHSNNMWFANYKAKPLVKATSDHYMMYSKSGEVSLIGIGAMEADSNNVIWIAPIGMGLSSIKDDKITHYTKKNGLADNSINHIFCSAKNKLWIGTVNGLSLYNGKTFTNFTTDDGLSNNIIESIIMDDRKYIWVATKHGLNCLKEDKSKPKGYSIENYYTTDGLKTNEFYRSSAAFNKNTRTLWWGTQRGAIYLDLNNFDQNKSSPAIHLSNVSLMDEHTDFKALNDSLIKGSDYFGSDSITTYNNVKFDSISPFYNIPINLSLPYNRNSITLEFYAFNGQSTNKIRYRYMLEGFDENWKYSNFPLAKYSNLNDGNYVLKAQAKFEGLDWAEPLIYTFSVRPPFWNTWWFRIFIVIGIISIVGAIFRWRNKQLIARQQQLEKTVIERTEEISKQKHLIEEKHKEITDSINYAERIQKSFLATNEHLDSNLKEYFILFKPKDIVSGDFYWSSNLTNGNFILATADSTGHGVPGAIMSLLNITSLEKAIETETEPSSILNTTRNIIIERLKKDGSTEGGKDGMDCSICVYDLINKKLVVAAAHNPVWIVRGEEIIEIKYDKMPVGKHDKQSTPFTQQEIQLKDGDIVYTLTDGYADQFGGPSGKKFMSKNLRKLLASNAHLSMKEQLKALETAFINWAKNIEQIDDVTVIGVRI